jgi:hypothetical protein
VITIEDAQTVIERLLTGEISRETHVALFDEDVVLFRVLVLEQRDAEWLLARVRDRSVPLSRRLTLVRLMRTLRGQALAIVREEDPSITD